MLTKEDIRELVTDLKDAKKNAAYFEQAYKGLQAERNQLVNSVESAFKEAFNKGKKLQYWDNKTATDAWLESASRARLKER